VSPGTSDRTHLEGQRDQLLAAIDDLDRELAAGLLDEVDHGELRDDHIRRAAETIRRIDGTGPAEKASPAGPTGRRMPLLALLAGFAVFAVVAGVALARASGERGVNDQLTGGVDPSSRDRLAECQALGSTEGDLVGSLECFDEVLVSDPDNPEALAYRGWYLILAVGSLQQNTEETTSDEVQAQADEALTQADELTESGLDYLDRAIAADPTYPDPYAFRAIVADRQGRADDACADVAALLALDPPDFFVTMTATLIERNGCDL
jgi:tetratricopeptide (TPR) repeat protein